MKTKNLKIIPILFSIILLTITTISCSKKTPAPTTLDNLIPITQTGANTFGCLMNGQVVIAKGKKGIFKTSGATPGAYPDEFYFSIVTENPRRDFNFYIRFDNKPGKFKCYSKDMNFISITDSVDKFGTFLGGANYYETNDSVSGVIEVTKIDDHTLSGVFNFDAQNNKKEIVHFTNGRFDFSIN
jgi:Family of unknown function (DUF6252)